VRRLKIGRLIPESTQDTITAGAFPSETCVITLPETFHFSDVLQN